MTDIDIAKLEELEKRATPGPWIADDLCMQDDNKVRVATYDGTETYYHTDATICECWINTDDPEKNEREPAINPLQAERNAAFIAASRNSLPALLARIRRLEAALADVLACDKQYDLHAYDYLHWYGEIRAVIDRAGAALEGEEDGK